MKCSFIAARDSVETDVCAHTIVKFTIVPSAPRGSRHGKFVHAHAAVYGRQVKPQHENSS